MTKRGLLVIRELWKNKPLSPPSEIPQRVFLVRKGLLQACALRRDKDAVKPRQTQLLPSRTFYSRGEDKYLTKLYSLIG